MRLPLGGLSAKNGSVDTEFTLVEVFMSEDLAGGEEMQPCQYIHTYCLSQSEGSVTNANWFEI